MKRSAKAGSLMLCPRPIPDGVGYTETKISCLVSFFVAPSDAAFEVVVVPGEDPPPRSKFEKEKSKL